MAIAQTMVGARARLNVGNNTVGIFNQVSYSLTLDTRAIDILGSYRPVEIVYTGSEAIQVTCTAWRVVGHGPHDPQGAQVPLLQGLLGHEDITLSIFDRQNPGTPIMTVVGVRPTGYSTQMTAKGVEELTVTYVGLILSDETGAQEDTGHVNFPV